MNITDELIEDLLLEVRVSKTEKSVRSITNLVRECIADMEAHHVKTDLTDLNVVSCIRFYVRGEYGNDKNHEEYRKQYEKKRDSMMLMKKYKVVGEDG